MSGSWFADDLFNAETSQGSLGWSYVTRPFYGHFLPAAAVPVWLGARLELHHTAVVLVELVLILLTTALLVALLRGIVGDRPVLVFGVAAVFALSPLELPGYLWWAAAVEIVPAQLCVVTALLIYRRWRDDHRAPQLVLLAGVTGVGICFWDPANLLIVWLPLLEMALGGPTVRDRLRGVVRSWPAWLAVLLPLVAYQAYYLSHGYASPHRLDPDLYGHFLRTGWWEAFVPALAGGPLRWSLSPIGYYGGAGAYLWLEVIAQVALVALVLATLWRNRRVWAAWLLVAAAAVSELTLVALGRLTNGVALAHDYRYHALALAPVLVGIAIAVHQAAPASRRPQVGAIVVVLVVLTSLISTYRYATTWSGLRTGDYLAAFAHDSQLLRASGGSVAVLDENVPPWIMPYDMLGPNASQLSRVLAPLRLRGVAFDGVADNLYRATPSGHLQPARLVATRPLVLLGPNCTTGRPKQHLVARSTSEPAAGSGYVIRLMTMSTAPSTLKVRLSENRAPHRLATFDARAFSAPSGSRTIVITEEGSSFDTLKITIDSTNPVCVTSADFSTLGTA